MNVGRYLRGEHLHVGTARITKLPSLNTQAVANAQAKARYEQEVKTTTPEERMKDFLTNGFC